MIKLRTRSCVVYRIMVDTRSFVEFLFLATIQALEAHDEDIVKKEMLLVGFSSSTTYVVGTIILPVMVTESNIMTKFLVIEILSYYNTILGRLWI